MPPEFTLPVGPVSHHVEVALRYQPVTVTTDGHSYPGLLVGWRWLSEQQKTWTGCVRYRGARGLQYEAWFPGEAITRDPT